MWGDGDCGLGFETESWLCVPVDEKEEVGSHCLEYWMDGVLED